MGPCEEILRENIVNYKSYEELVSTSSLPNKESKSSSEDQFFLAINIDDLPGGREEMVKYLLTNEENYFYNLQQAEGYFNAIVTHKNKVHVTEKQLTQIFGNLPEIVNVHRNIAILLQECRDEDDPEFGKLINTVLSSFSCYKFYTQNYPLALDTLKECAKHTAFTDFLMACRKEAGEALDSLLELPFKRLHHFLCFFQHLLNVTDTTHPDKNSLAMAVRKLDNLCTSLKTNQPS